MLTTTPDGDWLADGRLLSRQATAVQCEGCSNVFFVQPGVEFLPAFCCYCGSRTDSIRREGESFRRTLANQPIDQEGS